MEIFYIGTYDNNIQIANFENGKLLIVNQSTGIINPSYLHVNQDVLYAVSETQIGALHAFKINGNDLSLISSEIINQKSPCHISSDLKRNNLLVSNYGSGSLLMYHLNNDGTIGKIIDKVEYKNSHMHYSTIESENIYAVDLGNDVIYIYDYKMKLLSKIHTEKGDGPRHLCFSEDHKKLFIVTELSNKLLIYEKQSNEFELIQKLSTIPNQIVESYAGAIKITKNNKNIYITNRGHNSISVFKENNNKYELIQNISCFGDFPRDITLNQTEEYAIVANQKSNNVIIFKRDKENGLLTKLKDAEVIVKNPSCIVRSNYEI